MSLKVRACVDWDAATETCTAEAYIDPPTVIPMMTVEQGHEIGFAVFAAVAMVKAVSLIREAVTNRIDQ